MRELPDFADWVISQAQNATHFRVGRAAAPASSTRSAESGGGDESAEGKATASV
jgi:hypothetical protein